MPPLGFPSIESEGDLKAVLFGQERSLHLCRSGSFCEGYGPRILYDAAGLKCQLTGARRASEVEMRKSD